MTLKAIKKIKDLFLNNKKSYYFISPTNFNLIDIHNWVKGWTNINYIDCFDSKASQCFIPIQEDFRSFESMEEINEFLLGHVSTQKLIMNNSNGSIVYLFFNKALAKFIWKLEF